MQMRVRTLFLAASGVLALPMIAQQQGPLTPPPGTVVPSSAPAAETPKPTAAQQETSSHISNEQPPVPVQEIIQKFAQHEGEFRRERIISPTRRFLSFRNSMTTANRTENTALPAIFSLRRRGSATRKSWKRHHPASSVFPCRNRISMTSRKYGPSY